MSDRLDRIEALIESNAKSIEALTSKANQDSSLYRKDRAHVFEWMARLAAAQADFYESQSDYLDHLQRIEDKLTEILNRTTPNP
ncbi:MULTISPECIES: hypothetical protein [Synechocystis]|jgi:hypothetical protein|uniref:Uncharacterized protein n=1 Tax=Synechocystis salina LEGE 00031 TaxID=1828736 RepID=A0ABR9VRB9_9SYNC|nr:MULTISPECIES: hypothetical protein [Synechocystis]MBD2652850.1 hypothetical protein [Synechocystis sp. FACHB-383]MBE9242584.1 hypothetical protein [Synechocystis salina LEGE 00041]MBE9253875.1 hypothetical protein [Synechocystis salina LEGE 00031]QUS62505.1 hypothetical protein HTZ78_17415 [Synechocystis sp. PCC 7338]UAJ74572.1 hypothetical protein IQE94_18035 [Synechocystis sp. PCC 7339]